MLPLILILSACDTEDTLKTFNDNPVIDITSHDGELTVGEGETVEFRASDVLGVHRLEGVRELALGALDAVPAGLELADATVLLPAALPAADQ